MLYGFFAPGPSSSLPPNPCSTTRLVPRSSTCLVGLSSSRLYNFGAPRSVRSPASASSSVASLFVWHLLDSTCPNHLLYANWLSMILRLSPYLRLALALACLFSMLMSDFSQSTCLPSVPSTLIIYLPLDSLPQVQMSSRRNPSMPDNYHNLSSPRGLVTILATC